MIIFNIKKSVLSNFSEQKIGEQYSAKNVSAKNMTRRYFQIPCCNLDQAF